MAYDPLNDVIAAIEKSADDICAVIGDIIFPYESETVSRTIYVETTGNDSTGDGSIGAPFATIGKALSTINKKINDAVIMTISIGSGTFTFSANDAIVLESFTGAGQIIFSGTLTLIESGFTMGAPDANDPLKYAVSGGNTGTWTTNQFRRRFLKYAAAIYYPITHNTSTTLSLAAPQTGNEIYQMTTVINFGNNITSNVSAMTFQYLTFELTAGFVMTANWTISVLNCDFYYSNVASFAIQVKSRDAVFRYSSFTNVRIILNLASYFRGVSSLYINGNVNLPLITFQEHSLGSQTDGMNLVLENPNTGSGACCLAIQTILTGSNISPTQYVKFINSNVGIQTFRGSQRYGYPISSMAIIMVATNYLYRKVSTGISDYIPLAIDFPNSVVYGTPVVRWFYDAMYEFVNFMSGRKITLKNVIYPESEQNISATLTNNTTTNIIVGNKLQNRSIRIEYTITRGTAFRKGSFDILNDGTSLYVSPDTFITNGGAGVSAAAIVLTANYNTNEIRVAALLDNGVAGTFVYNASRVMITPLTI